MIPVTIEALRRRVRETHGPQFLLSARFASASFAGYAPDPAYPSQKEALARMREAAVTAPPRRRRWGRRPAPAGARGVYLDGPPGIGKTHLLAAAFNASAEPKLFATFDEFAAAAGTLGMRRLSQLLAEQRLVCVDEIDLRDPGNIMLLVSLLRAMLAGHPRILATANADPTGTSSAWVTVDDFRRELGEIADAFQVVSVDGIDHREVLAAAPRPAGDRTWTTSWDELLGFLVETHPMYDAAWLLEVDAVALDRLALLPDSDRALRFVRFIDRVYDRDVALSVRRRDLTPDAPLAPLLGDRRFVLHVARCRSRLVELLAAGGAGLRSAAD
ncbi:MAG TPA: AFG1/ZapE family ATPase [Thermomicrobiaceae bacterium]|nr:AFG1/ZapE family ATPase [Thermomicrobiaceae bacterium]